MRRRTVAIVVLAATLGLRMVPVPTGSVGRKVLAWLTPEGGAFVLKAERVAWRFPFGARLSQARVESGIDLRSPALEVGVSPWRLLTGTVRITGIEADSLTVRTAPRASGVLKTLDALDSVALGRWFPEGTLPTRVRVEHLTVRSDAGSLLLQGRGLRLSRDGQDLSMDADSLQVLGTLAGGDFRAKGRLPLALDTFGMELPGGRLHGHLAKEARELVATLGFELDLGGMPLGMDSARAEGCARADSLTVRIPLSEKPIRLQGRIVADSVRLQDFSYARDVWAKSYAPELSRVGLGRVEVVPGALDGEKLQILSLKAAGDTLRFEAKGWVKLDGKVQLRVRVEMSDAYSATRPGLLRAALQPGKGGFHRTSVELSGSLAQLRIAPTSEAVADAASNPFRSLSELFH